MTPAENISIFSLISVFDLNNSGAINPGVPHIYNDIFYFLIS